MESKILDGTEGFIVLQSAADGYRNTEFFKYNLEWKKRIFQMHFHWNILDLSLFFLIYSNFM